MKYYIPIYGWIIATHEWNIAIKDHQKALDNGQNGVVECLKTCQTFQNVTKGYLVTFTPTVLIFLIVCVITFWRFV